MIPYRPPAFLTPLNEEEEMMIARIAINVKLYVKRHGMTGIYGHIIHYKQKVQHLVN